MSMFGDYYFVAWGEDAKASAGTLPVGRVLRAGPRNFYERRRIKMFLAKPSPELIRYPLFLALLYKAYFT